MKNIVITELYLAARLYRVGLLKYFSNQELCFYITDFCYNAKTAFPNDRQTGKKMLDEGLLKIINLTETQMIRAEKLFYHYRPRFVIKTMTAYVFADENQYRLFSDDELVRDIAASDFGIKSINKEWLVTSLVNEISLMGGNVDIELVRQMV